MLGGCTCTVWRMRREDKDLSGGAAEARLAAAATVYEADRAERWYQAWLKRQQKAATQANDTEEA